MHLDGAWSGVAASPLLDSSREGTELMVAGHLTGRPHVRGQRERSPTRTGPWVLAACVVAAALLMVIVVGGYALHWRWTGLSGSVTLWEWLQVLVLPLALAAAPVLVRRRRGLRGRHKRAMAAGALAFAALVVAGYVVPMGWTGFTGNTLWNWLELLLLPVVIATASLWATSWPLARYARRHRRGCDSRDRDPGRAWLHDSVAVDRILGQHRVGLAQAAAAPGHGAAGARPVVR